MTQPHTIIETLAGQFFRVVEYGTPDLAHVWEGVEVKRAKGGFVDKKNARKFPVRKIGTRVVVAALVPQPVQQQQAQAKPRETAAEWAARMDRKKPRRAPRPVAEDSPAMKAGLAIAAEAGRAHAERRMAAAAEHSITAPLALAGRYRSAR